jgi:hypothetical protein
MDDDDAYLDSLRRERHLPLRGNSPGDWNYDLAEGQVGRGARTFAATVPDFVLDIVDRSDINRNRTGATHRDTKGSRFSNQDGTDPREKCWKNNHVVNTIKEWGTIKDPFPTLAPITKLVEIKNTIYVVFTRKNRLHTRGLERQDCIRNSFEDVVPAASLQGEMAMQDLTDVTTDTFVFSDVETLDANLASLPRGNQNALDHPQAARDRTRFLRFTLTAHPRNINPGALHINPTEFPGQQATAVKEPNSTHA